MNGDFEITETYFKSLTPEQRDWLIFTEFNAQRCECSRRFQRLERRRFWDKSVAVVSGAITAALVALGVISGRG